MGVESSLYKLQFDLRQRAIGRYYRFRGRPHGDGTVSVDGFDRVLFVVAGLLGDSVMSSPVLAEARRLMPNARVTVLGKSHNRDLLYADPNVDEIYVCDADPMSIRRSEDVSRLRGWLRTSNFDAAVILLGDQYAHLLAAAGIPVRVGVKGTLLEPCLTHTYGIRSFREWGSEDRLNSLRTLGFEIRASEPKVYVSDDARATARQKLISIGLEVASRYLAFHPFGSTSRQWWKTTEAGSLARQVWDRYRLKTVVIGGPETMDAEIGATGPELFDTRGILSIPELIAVLGEAELVVSTDSGPFHIAGGLQKSIVGLFRARRPEHARAYSSANVVFGEDRECEKRCEWNLCRNDPCDQMAQISPETVLNRIGELLIG